MFINIPPHSYRRMAGLLIPQIPRTNLRLVFSQKEHSLLKTPSHRGNARDFFVTRVSNFRKIQRSRAFLREAARVRDNAAMFCFERRITTTCHWFGVWCVFSRANHFLNFWLFHEFCTSRRFVDSLLKTCACARKSNLRRTLFKRRQ